MPDFVLSQPQLLTTLGRRMEFLGHLDKLFDDLGSLDSALLVTFDYVAQHLGELLLLNQVADEACLNFPFQLAF